MTSGNALTLVEKSPSAPQKLRLKENLATRSYVVRDGAVAESEADNALQAKRHQRRMEARRIL